MMQRRVEDFDLAKLCRHQRRRCTAPTNREDELLTVQEVADQLRLNQQTVRNWLTDGKLASVRVGSRRVRIRRAGLDALLGKSTTGERRPKAEPGGERAALARALDHARTAVDGDNAELSTALRAVARAAQRLADALSTE